MAASAGSRRLKSFVMKTAERLFAPIRHAAVKGEAVTVPGFGPFKVQRESRRAGGAI
jgi:nucleoid DNA-binding protein